MNKTHAMSPSASAALQGQGPSPWQLHATRIAAIREEAPGVRTYSLAFAPRSPRPRFRFAAGQFNMISLPGIGEAAISITSDPELLSGIAHTVHAVGNVTRALTRLKVGDELLLRGPYGVPWPLGDMRDRDLVLVAGGLGLASLLSAIAFCMSHRGDYGRITVLSGAKTPADLLAAEGRDDEAAQRFRERNAADQSDPIPLLRLADLALRAGHHDRAHGVVIGPVRQRPIHRADHAVGQRVDGLRAIEGEESDATVDAGQDFVGLGAHHGNLRP